jgi:hypothetical protein
VGLVKGAGSGRCVVMRLNESHRVTEERVGKVGGMWYQCSQATNAYRLFGTMVEGFWSSQ